MSSTDAEIDHAHMLVNLAIRVHDRITANKVEEAQTFARQLAREAAAFAAKL